MDQQPTKSWWGRNWIWVVPVGCLLPVVVVGGCVTVLVVFVFGVMKSSEAYIQSLAAVRVDSEVQAALGQPIEPSALVAGSVEVSGAGGHAYNVSGPKGVGTVYVEADKQAGQWVFKSLTVEIGGTGERIDVNANKVAGERTEEGVEEQAEEAQDDGA